MPILAVATGKEFNGNEIEIASIENAKFNCALEMLEDRATYLLKCNILELFTLYFLIYIRL